jgi:hypothetical protein
LKIKLLAGERECLGLRFLIGGGWMTVEPSVPKFVPKREESPRYRKVRGEQDFPLVRESYRIQLLPFLVDEGQSRDHHAVGHGKPDAQ